MEVPLAIASRGLDAIRADTQPMLGAREGAAARVPLTFSGALPAGDGVNISLSHPGCVVDTAAADSSQPGVVAVFGCNITPGYEPTRVGFNVTSGGAGARAWWRWVCSRRARAAGACAHLF